MNNRLLFVAVAGSQTVGNYVTAFSGYDYRPVGPHAWIVKANISAKEFWAKARGTLPEGQTVIFQLDETAIQNGIVPQEIATYTGVSAAA